MRQSRPPQWSCIRAYLHGHGSPPSLWMGAPLWIWDGVKLHRWTCMSIGMHTYIHACIHAYMHACSMHTCIHTYMCIYRHTSSWRAIWISCWVCVWPGGALGPDPAHVGPKGSFRPGLGHVSLDMPAPTPEQAAKTSPLGAGQRGNRATPATASCLRGSVAVFVSERSSIREERSQGAQRTTLEANT